MVNPTNVWIYARPGVLRLSSRMKELLSAGRNIADSLDEQVCCVLLTEEVGDMAQEAIAHGADQVIVWQDPRLKNAGTDLYLQVLHALAREHAPRVILLGRSPADLAPRLALQLDAGLATDCVMLDVDLEKKALRMTRPMYGGNAHAVLSCDRFPQLATLRPKATNIREPDAGRTGEIRSFTPAFSPNESSIRVIETHIEAQSSRKLEEAEVIVCGGRGIGSAEGFQGPLSALAEALGGVVGASRPPADDGWVPSALHIGLTGKVVAPQLYLAVGVSGASQHLAGCASAKTIIAVNKDPEAYIFKHADYGIVGNWQDILPAFTEKIKALKSQG